VASQIPSGSSVVLRRAALAAGWNVNDVQAPVTPAAETILPMQMFSAGCLHASSLLLTTQSGTRRRKHARLPAAFLTHRVLDAALLAAALAVVPLAHSVKADWTVARM